MNTNFYFAELFNHIQRISTRCQLRVGQIFFECGELPFSACLTIEENFGECMLTFKCWDDDYERLTEEDKTFIGCKVSADHEHVKVLTHNAYFEVNTSFYFSDVDMMISLFTKHLDELKECLMDIFGFLCVKLNELPTNE